VLCALAGLVAPGAGASPPSLTVGFGDSLFSAEEVATRESWLGRAAATGASIVRVNVLWSTIAPKAPAAGFEPSDPGAPGYEWKGLDAAMRSAAAAGLRVMLTVYSAPRWAEGGGRPRNMLPGTWEPRADAYGAFAEALARRYDGRYPDPSSPGTALPAVHDFEAWNEPNLDTYLSPQWTATESKGPGLYRGLLNGFYAGVKAAQPKANVIAGSLAPFGDPPGGERTAPVLFLRTLLCLKGDSLATVPCPQPARFDTLSDHPIAVGGPQRSASSPLDVTTPDLGRLTAIVHRAAATDRIRPKGEKPLWVTEFWYDTDPPDPDGVSLATQARWYEQDLYSFWAQGAKVAIALQLRDAPEGVGYALTSQSGAYFVDGSPKPSAKAFRFPLVAHRTGPFKAGVWGIAPRTGNVAIQAHRSGGWRTLATVHAAGPGHPFAAEIQLLRFAKLRAVIGGEASLPWDQR
jgi:hypothetical protein